MTQSEFFWNCKIGGLLAVASAATILMARFQIVQSKQFPPLVLFATGVFLMFRVFVPWVFTCLRRFNTAEMNADMKRHPLSKFFIVER
ncbi:hypothetical protein [Pseudoprimorskyibacter insulae]|uniref:Uncharacterized protein n=1 Tax=Pseudoprimorskyibacter insulae TaxID=1695997 RepID=A0A2R8B044_9RHOB|nr:hypothetical protein [Pseudoprimorskyibacter insulae]SPF81633.1 hypothetical protein PRI8871_03458 [Pseudoprimorskyibacter insulae]